MVRGEVGARAVIVVSGYGLKKRTVAVLKARDVQIAYGPYAARGNSMSNFIIKDNSGNLIQFFGK